MKYCPAFQNLFCSSQSPAQIFTLGLRMVLFTALAWGWIPQNITCAQVNPRRNQKPDTLEGREALEAQLVEDAFKQGERSVFLPAPREVLRPLIRARRALHDNDMARAVTLLGEVLTDTSSEDFLIPDTSADRVSTSLRRRAQMILGALPAKDRELYRTRYGVQAKQMLEKAIQDSDYQKVSEVMTRFFYTDAGYDAAMLLGHHHLDQGRPIAAANCFNRIAKTPEARQIHDPEASVLLATCWMMGDSPERATAALVNLQTNSTKKTIQFLGKPVPLFERPEDANTWLLELIGESPLRNIAVVNQWVMVGGNPQRNARSGTGFPLLNPRWVTPTVNNPDLEDAVKKRQRDLIALGSSPIPSVQPLAVGNTIVMRAFDRMVGVDFETGKRVWVFPPWNFATRFETPEQRIRTRKVTEESLTERMWLDSIYGQASSNGKKIFVVPKPGFSTQVSTDGSEEGVEPALERTFNEMMAIDIAREGAFSWEVGGESGLDEPKLAKAFFLGPPLPLGNELFAVCQQDNEIRLVVLDSESGKLKWIQQLGTTEPNMKRMDVQADRFRRLAGVTPSLSNGILVCATGTGALVAVDLSTRSLLWGYQYATPGSKSIQRLSPFSVSKTDQLGGLWRDSTILIADGKVLFTPVDSQDMICVDLQNGHPAWNQKGIMSSKAPRRESLFLACAENGKAILIGGQQVRSIDLTNGKNDWATSLQQFGRPSGRGYANRGSYYLPTTKERLIEIELATGNIIRTVKTDGVLGNLICYRGEVISHGVDRLASFPQDEPSRKRIEAAIVSGEVSPQLLSIKAQIEFQDGNLRQAITSIQQSYEKAPNVSSEKLLLDLLLQQVEKDFDVGMKLASKYETQLLTNRRFEFLAAKINGMIRNNQPVAALDSLFQLAEPIEDFGLLAEKTLTIPASKHDATLGGSNNERQPTTTHETTIRIDRWIGSRIKLIYTDATPDIKNAIEAQALAYSQRVTDFQPEVRFQVMDLFPMSSWPKQSTLALANDFSQQGESVRTIQLLHSVLRSDSKGDDNELAHATMQMANEYLRRELWDRAIPLIRALETTFADTMISIGEQPQLRGSKFARSFNKLIPKNLDSVKAIKWNRGDVRFNEKSVNLSQAALLTPSVINLKNYDLSKYARYQYRFFSQTGEIEILDEFGMTAHRFVARTDSDSVFRSYNTYKMGHISVRDNLAILDIGAEIFAFDWLKLKSSESPMLWNTIARSTRGIPTSVAFETTWGETSTKTPPNGRDQYPVIAESGVNGVCLLDDRDLIALDPITGQEIWRRSGFEPNSKLFSDSNHVVVWDESKRIGQVINVLDGRLIKATTLAKDVGIAWTANGAKMLFAGTLELKPAAETSPENPLRNKGDTENKPYKEDPKLIRQVIGLYDFLEERFVWQKDFPFKTKACRVENNRLAILRPTGDLEFVSLATGQTELRTPVQLSPLKRRRISGIGVHAANGKYLVHFKNGDSANRVEIRTGLETIEARYLNYNAPMWVGFLSSVDSTTGKNNWKSPVRFEHFQIAQGQPDRCPLYFLNRRVDVDNEMGESNSFLQFVGIDIATGKLKTNSMSQYSYQFQYRLKCLANQQRIQIDYRGNRLTYEFDEQTDLPPTPVAQLTDYNSIEKTKEDEPESPPIDPGVIEAEKIKSLKRAQAAQALLPQKRADEKKKLEAERNGK